MKTFRHYFCSSRDGVKRKNVWLPPDLIAQLSLSQKLNWGGKHSESCWPQIQTLSGRPAHQLAAPKRLKLWSPRVFWVYGPVKFQVTCCSSLRLTNSWRGSISTSPSGRHMPPSSHTRVWRDEGHPALRPSRSVALSGLSSAALHWRVTDPCVRHSNHFMTNALLSPARYVSTALCSSEQTSTLKRYQKGLFFRSITGSLNPCLSFPLSRGQGESQSQWAPQGVK